jgi:hypothetical protein
MQFQELDEQEIQSDQAIVILEEFPYASLNIIAPVVAALKIDAPTLRRVISVTKQLRHILHEQHPVSTSLMIIPAQLRELILARCFVTPRSPLLIGQEASVRVLASFVDGVCGGVAVAASGEVLGCISYIADGAEESVPERLAPALSESRLLGALAFVFVGSGRATVISAGKRILAYRNAKWYVLHADPLVYLDSIEKTLSLAEGILRHAYKFAMRMSDLGQGVILMIGDHQAVLSLEENWTIVEPLAKQDGALIVTSDGLVIEGKRMLRPPVDAAAVVPAGTGARHSSAAKMTFISGAIAVVVSSDGPLTVFQNGRAVLSDIA